MINIKHSLLAATIVAGAAATPVMAQSQTTPFTAAQLNTIEAPGLPLSSQTVNGSSVSYDGDTALHGAGATSIQNVLVRAMNCLGTPNKLGNGQPGAAGSAAVGSLGAKSGGVFAGSPTMTCNNTSANVSPNGTSTYLVQPQDGEGHGFQGKYVGTGSGFGRKAWYWFADVFDSGSSSHAVTGVSNPFNTVNGDNRWSHIQYAFSDAPIAASDLATYNTTNNAVTFAGPAVQFPLFVLPVAIAYDQQYGTNKNGKGMVFNTQYSAAYSNGSTISSMRLNAAAYCGIFNGSITNWNDPALTALNKKVPLFDPTNDTLARWTTDGAPIRLVGRLDNSGTTDVFTRHLAAVCSNPAIYSGTNKYLNHAESLPYNAGTNGGIDYRTVRSDVNYFPTQATSKFAGTTNTVSSDYFNGTSIVYGYTGNVSSLPIGYTGSGNFIVTNGGGNLAKLLTLADDLVEPDGVTLNGKVGYISADFVQPSVDSSSGLVAALLGVGSGAAPTVFDAPTIKNGLTAIGTILPPESSSTGTYSPSTEDRTLPAGDGTTTRTNPIAWTDVLYTTSSTQAYSLAAPTVGYPITGTTQFFGYTCYATVGNREAIAELLGTSLAKITKDATATAINKGFLNGTTAATPGIYDQSNIGILPVAWQTAIADTFLSSTSDVNKALATPLYITSALVSTDPSVTTPAVKANPKANPPVVAAPAYKTYTLTQPTANPACASLPGA
jgi:ABC-type phosphate transport system substrate-binding protein